MGRSMSVIIKRQGLLIPGPTPERHSQSNRGMSPASLHSRPACFINAHDNDRTFHLILPLPPVGPSWFTMVNCLSLAEVLWL